MPNLNVLLRRAGLLAGAAFLAVVPYAYRSAHTFSGRFAQTLKLSPNEVLQADLLSMATLVVLCALIGSAFAERYGLAGVGDLQTLRAARKHLWLAPILGVVSYVAFGRVLAARLPGTFPEAPAWALAYALKGAVFEEVVARYGMMTIFSGLASRPIANLLQATFFTALIWKGLDFFGVEPAFDLYFALSVVSSFGLHVYLGSLCARYGLLAAMAVHFLYDLRFVVHAVVLLGTSGSR